MEKENLCVLSDEQPIKKLSEALVMQGITEGAQFYYTDDDYSTPFFKLPKAYKKESPDDPDAQYVFVDVETDMYKEGEYTVHGNYVHEHITDADRAAMLVARLLKGEIAEVAIVYPDRLAGFFVNNTGDPKKNVGIIVENFKEIKGYFESDTMAAPCAGLMHGHIHALFPQIHLFPNYLQYGFSTEHRISGINIYMVSSVVGEHPEFYVIQ